MEVALCQPPLRAAARSGPAPATTGLHCGSSAENQGVSHDSGITEHQGQEEQRGGGVGEQQGETLHPSSSSLGLDETDPSPGDKTPPHSPPHPHSSPLCWGVGGGYWSSLMSQSKDESDLLLLADL